VLGLAGIAGAFPFPYSWTDSASGTGMPAGNQPQGRAGGENIFYTGSPSPGTVKNVDLAAHTFTIKNRRGEQTFVISPETQLKKGRERLRLDGLQPESKVTVSYWDRNGKKEAGVIKLSK